MLGMFFTYSPGQKDIVVIVNHYKQKDLISVRPPSQNRGPKLYIKVSLSTVAYEKLLK